MHQPKDESPSPEPREHKLNHKNAVINHTLDKWSSTCAPVPVVYVHNFYLGVNKIYFGLHES